MLFSAFRVCIDYQRAHTMIKALHNYNVCCFMCFCFVFASNSLVLPIVAEFCWFWFCLLSFFLLLTSLFLLSVLVLKILGSVWRLLEFPAVSRVHPPRDECLFQILTWDFGSVGTTGSVPSAQLVSA